MAGSGGPWRLPSQKPGWDAPRASIHPPPAALHVACSGSFTGRSNNLPRPYPSLQTPRLDATGRDYRRYFQPGDPNVLDCAYHAGHAYAEIGKPAKALPQLRFCVQNADTAGIADEARKVLETRFVIAQLLAADGYPDEALAELHAVPPLLADTFGPDSVQIRNLDKQAVRLRTPL